MLPILRHLKPGTARRSAKLFLSANDATNRFVS